MRRKSSFSKDRAPDQASSRRKVSWTGKPEYRSKVEQQRQEQRQQNLQDVGTAPPRKGSVDVAVRRNSLELRRAAKASKLEQPMKVTVAQPASPDDMRRKSSFSKDRAPDQASSRRKVSWTGKPEYRSKVEQQRQEQRQQDFQDVGTAPPRKGSVDVAVRRNSLELRRAATSPTTASAAPSKVSVLSSDILPWHT
jgi:hypothetical protein